MVFVSYRALTRAFTCTSNNCQRAPFSLPTSWCVSAGLHAARGKNRRGQRWGPALPSQDALPPNALRPHTAAPSKAPSKGMQTALQFAKNDQFGFHFFFSQKRYIETHHSALQNSWHGALCDDTMTLKHLLVIAVSTSTALTSRSSCMVYIAYAQCVGQKSR